MPNETYYYATGSEITTIANAIRAKTGNDGQIQFPDGFASAIASISGGSGTPSATQHTIYFEFTDETNETIYLYYNDSFITNAITSTQPTTHNGKLVTLAQLDGTTWYNASATWETIWNNNTPFYHDGEVDEADRYPYCWIQELGDIDMQVGTSWRVTFDGIEYYLTATYSLVDNGVIIGNNIFYGGAGTGYDNVPFSLGPSPWNAWVGSLNARNVDSIHSLKIERLSTSSS